MKLIHHLIISLIFCLAAYSVHADDAAGYRIIGGRQYDLNLYADWSKQYDILCDKYGLESPTVRKYLANRPPTPPVHLKGKVLQRLKSGILVAEEGGDVVYVKNAPNEAYLVDGYFFDEYADFASPFQYTSVQGALKTVTGYDCGLPMSKEQIDTMLADRKKAAQKAADEAAVAAMEAAEKQKAAEDKRKADLAERVRKFREEQAAKAAKEAAEATAAK